MADTLKDGLEKLLDAYYERRRAVLEREKKIREDDALFLERFKELRKSMIRPAFEEVGAILAARGHGFSIHEDELETSGGSEVREAGITLKIMPSGMAAPMHDDHGRSFSITTRHYNKTVWINAGRPLDAGGVAGSKGAHALEKVTRALVEDELLKFVAAVVAA